MARYFAYGSNLEQGRMHDRVPSARPSGTARLPGYRFACDKLGADGSGKANLRLDAGSSVWGAVYTLDPAHWPDLDLCEPGYDRREVKVICDGQALVADTYTSLLITEDPVPFASYKRLVLEGAKQHALPDDWLRVLEAWPARADP